MTFKDFNLKKEILEQVEAVGYVTPTPIQEKAIPEILERHDLLGLAKTGTGKTAAFALPILERIATVKPSGKGVRALVIAPTRELAEQINNTFLQLGKKMGIRSVTMYGGVSSKPQLEALKNGVDIIVGCPGRILDHLTQDKLSLTRLEVLVLDEADHMLDMGFLKDIEKIIKFTPKKRQTLFFSATMPKEIKNLAFKVLDKEHKIVEIEYKEPVKLIEHELYHIKHDDKKAKLIEILQSPEVDSAIVFTNGKHKAKNLSRILAGKGIKAVNFQGNLSQNQRESALNGFRTGEFKVLVATDIAARGLDIPQVTHVVNFDLPQTLEAFTHRSGRTGRANRAGIVISFAMADESKMLSDIINKNGIKFRAVHGEAGDPSEKRPQRPARPPRKKVQDQDKKTSSERNERSSQTKVQGKTLDKAKSKAKDSEKPHVKNSAKKSKNIVKNTPQKNSNSGIK